MASMDEDMQRAGEKLQEASDRFRADDERKAEIGDILAEYESDVDRWAVEAPIDIETVVGAERATAAT